MNYLEGYSQYHYQGIGRCIVLYCIVLYCIALYCIVLYCIVLFTDEWGAWEILSSQSWVFHHWCVWHILLMSSLYDTLCEWYIFTTGVYDTYCVNDTYSPLVCMTHIVLMFFRCWWCIEFWTNTWHLVAWY